MSLPKYKDLKEINQEESIEQEICLLQKTLFDLKFKNSLNQGIQSHLISHTKRKIAQLKGKKQLLRKS